MQINLRPAQPSDRPFLLELYSSTRIEEVSARGWDTLQQQAFMRMQHQAQEWQYQGQFSQIEDYLVTVGKEPVGRLVVSHEDGHLQLVHMALLAEYRNRGIGSGLIRMLQMKTARTGKNIRLEIPKSNRAAAFFMRLGFQVSGEQGHAVEMVWQLPLGAQPLEKRIRTSPRRNGGGIQRG
jgi:ribosomal protein S18 acetylase RimI-like enzyme